MEGLQSVFEDEHERHAHIIKNMIYMVELKETNVKHLINLFGKEANIICADYTSLSSQTHISIPNAFDYIIGNPPYNSDGIKKVPSNVKMHKTEDGKTIWKSFVTKSLSLLKKNTGKLLYIIPSIWMKPDKYMIYNLLTSYKLEKLHCLSNTETNKYFKGEAQTPTCFFLLTNKPTHDYHVELYDTDKNGYVNYSIKDSMQMPVFGASIVKKLLQYCAQYGNISTLVKKTNCPSKGTLFSLTQSAEYHYKNIKTCVLDKDENNNNIPTLVIEYSNKPQAFYGKPKVVMAHKMYGFPFIDKDGEYGISARDNYVICCNNNNNNNQTDLKTIQIYLSTRLALYLFESTRYRMKYLEKYAFVFIPNILNMNNDIVSHILADYNNADQLLMNYFGLDKDEQQSVLSLHKKMYKSFN